MKKFILFIVSTLFFTACYSNKVVPGEPIIPGTYLSTKSSPRVKTIPVKIKVSFNSTPSDSQIECSETTKKWNLFYSSKISIDDPKYKKGKVFDFDAYQNDHNAISMSTEAQAIQNEVKTKCQGVKEITHISKLERHAPKVLVAYLIPKDNIEIIYTYKEHRSDYTIYFDFIEQIADIEARKENTDSALSSIGNTIQMVTPYVASASPMLGPIGSFLTLFDIFTGLPSGGYSGKTTGLLSFNVKVVDEASGEIALSFKSEATFGVTFGGLGSSIATESDLGSGFTKLKLVTTTEALEEIARNAADKIAEFFATQN